jgi:hypothetical protein
MARALLAIHVFSNTNERIHKRTQKKTNGTDPSNEHTARLAQKSAPPWQEKDRTEQNHQQKTLYHLHGEDEAWQNTIQNNDDTSILLCHPPQHKL